eukprot:gnl/Hemi2/2218_TR793_c0_g1_i1.p1 gnl/Hemi2/2218_TR793_c0_g1~~gnl/Hemi2/2218_TR793_c0_g1_i1.p1  ORF type:complete len:228 (-),score=59.29 gnl/Hemi2/2218_TR793_c0_g1_i1:330-965(-)
MSRFMSRYDLLIKLLLIGDSHVGKSCLLLRFADDDYMSMVASIGIDVKIKTVEIDGKIVKLQIWDSAGQERYHTITKAYYRRANGILLVYDVTDAKSFNHVSGWLDSIAKEAPSSITTMLIGNKCDMGFARQVDTQQGQAVAEEHQLRFFETSAKEKLNVTQAFMAIARDIKAKMDQTPPDPTRFPFPAPTQILDPTKPPPSTTTKDSCSC